MKINIRLTLLLGVILIVPLLESCKQVQKVRDDVMEYSLNKLGDTFFSMMADSPEKTELQEKYNAFVQRSVDGQVEQEQIEYVAANMLNASNSQDRIDPKLASSIVNATDLDKEPSSVDGLANDWEGLDDSELKNLGEKLSKLLDFNEELKTVYTDVDFSDKVFYKFDEKIEINIDEEIKIAMEETKKSLEALEYFKENQDFTWVNDLKEDLKKEQAKMKEEMKKWKDMEFDFSDYMKDGKYMQFYFNDSNFVMPEIPTVNIDSIMQAVQQSLKEAGIKTENN